MAHIKYPRISSNCCVFIDDPTIADRHVVAGKLSHLRTQCNMFLGKWSFLHVFEIGAKVLKSYLPIRSMIGKTTLIFSIFQNGVISAIILSTGFSLFILR